MFKVGDKVRLTDYARQKWLYPTNEKYGFLFDPNYIHTVSHLDNWGLYIPKPDGTPFLYINWKREFLLGFELAYPFELTYEPAKERLP